MLGPFKNFNERRNENLGLQENNTIYIERPMKKRVLKEIVQYAKDTEENITVIVKNLDEYNIIIGELKKLDNSIDWDTRFVALLRSSTRIYDLVI